MATDLAGEGGDSASPAAEGSGANSRCTGRSEGSFRDACAGLKAGDDATIQERQCGRGVKISVRGWKRNLPLVIGNRYATWDWSG